MHYKWDIQGKASSLQDILRYIAKERNFNKEQMLEFLKSKNKIYNPYLFKNMDKIVEKIKYHIKNENKILIVGDYDCDGVFASYILYMALKYLNAFVDVKLPHRLHDGYGLKPKLINFAYENKYDLIITVDNGIAAIEAVNLANKLNIDIIVTDHHQPQDELPNCLFLDAHVEGSNYPFNGLCGAGVAFKLSDALIENFNKTPIYKDLLQGCAIATVADAMDIVDENRAIVIEGLKILNSNDKNIGIKKLLERMNYQDKEIKLDTIGFNIGPCINAAGRLDTPNRALDLLLSDDDYTSEKKANELVELNEKRKTLQKNITDNLSVNTDNYCLIVEIPANIAGIGGIIASNVAEKYQKPCFVVHGNDILTGSGRTIGDFPIIDCLTLNKDVINSGGGHAAACGFSIKREMLEKFQDRCNKIYNKWLKVNPELIYPTLKATCEIDFRLVSERLYHNMSKLQPFGNGNQEPVFVTRNVQIISSKVVGELQNAIQFKFFNKNINLNGIGFLQIKNKYLELNQPANVDIMYSININEWPKGKYNLQLQMIDLIPSKNY